MTGAEIAGKGDEIKCVGVISVTASNEEYSTPSMDWLRYSTWFVLSSYPHIKSMRSSASIISISPSSSTEVSQSTEVSSNT